MSSVNKAKIVKDLQYYKFCLYGFLKNQRFFEPFLIIIFLQVKSLSFTQIGVLYSIRFILRAIFEIPSGIIADALGRRGVMLFSYSAYMLSFLAYYFANTFVILIIPSCLFALGDAFRTGTHKAMIFEYLKRKGWQNQRVNYYGHTRSWSQAGSAISSLLAAAFVLISGNYNLIFLFSLAPYVIGFLLLASYPAYLEGTLEKSRSLKFHALFQITKNTFKTFKQLPILSLSLNISAFSGFYASAKDYLQIILSAAVVSLPILNRGSFDLHQKEVLLIGIAYFIMYFINSWASRSSGTVQQLFKSDRKHINTLLVLGLITSLIAGLFLKLNLPFLSAIFFVNILIIENLRRPAGIAHLASKADSGILASVLSVESQLNSVFAAGVSLVIGIFADMLNPGYAIIISATCIIILYPLLYLRK